LYSFSEIGARKQWRIQTRRLGVSEIRGRQKISIVEIPKVACDNRWISRKSGYLL